MSKKNEGKETNCQEARAAGENKCKSHCKSRMMIFGKQLEVTEKTNGVKDGI